MSRNIETLLRLFTPEELSTLPPLPPNETPLWKYWDKFVPHYIRIGRSYSTVQNTKDSLRWLVLKLKISTIEDCFDIFKMNDAFHKYREERGIKFNTFNSYRKNVNTYFLFLTNFGIIDKNPIMRIQKCAKEEHPKHIQTEEQIAQIVLLISTQRSSTFERARNLLLIDLLRYTGARPIEISNLKLTDITPMKDTFKIRIQGAKQNRKPRYYRMKGYMKDSYLRYMELRKNWRTDEEWLLLSRKHGQALGLKGIHYLFRNLSSKLDFRITAYGFRRYVATKLYQEGLPIEKVGSHLGHTRSSTTRCYLDDLCDWTDEGTDILSK